MSYLALLAHILKHGDLLVLNGLDSICECLHACIFGECPLVVPLLEELIALLLILESLFHYACILLHVNDAY